MQDEKSQLQNREKALRVLRARLYERALAEQQAELAADRRSQVGTGDRAEKIRTYNYGERRVTDHRIKLTAHNLDQVLEGELDELTEALQADEKRRRLEAQAGRHGGGQPRGAAGHAVGDALDGAITAITAAGCETPAPGRGSAARARARRARASGCIRERELALAGRPCAPSSTPSAAAPSSASRSPTSSGVAASAASSWPSTRARSSRGRRPSCSSKSALGAAARAPACSTSAPARGAVALALKDERPTCWSAAATSAARARARGENVARLGLAVELAARGPARRLPDEFEAVLANPPYVAESERAVASRPRSCATSPPPALFAGPDGLAVIRRLAGQLRCAGAFSRPGGRGRAGPASPS